ncbi:DUF4870 domain-containing protein [Salegentibacter sp. HM20]
MDSSIKKQDTTLGVLIHLSTFSKYFIPFGNFILPLILWLTKKEDRFIDHHGRSALNFQISLFLYFVVLVVGGIAGLVFIASGIGMLDELYIGPQHHPFEELSKALPLLTYIIIFAVLLLALLILELFAVISASIKAGEGKYYKYPLSIPFLKPENPVNSSNHQSKNEQSNNTQNSTL